VGRIGGLAVAFGIGTAVLTGFGCGTASADTTDSSSSADSSSHSESASTENTKTTTDTKTREAADDAPASSQARHRPRPEAKSGHKHEKTADSDSAASESTTVKTVSTVPDSTKTTTSTPAKKSDNAPKLVALSVLSAARRELDDVAANVTAATKVAPPTANATAATAPPLTKEQYLSAFSGKPSLIANLVITGIRVYDVVSTVLHLPTFNEIGSLLGGGSGAPPALVTGGLKVHSSQYDGWQVYTLTPSDPTGKEAVAIHGGAYSGQVNILQWATYANTARTTGATVVVPLFPLAPTGTAGTVVPKMADFIAAQVDANGADNVSVLGDSSGGQIALSAVQLMIRRGEKVPGHMVLISPVLDNTFTNPNIALVDDPLVSAADGRHTAQLWAGGLPLTDPLVSPLYGSFDGLPPTTVYSGSLSLLAPDALVLQQKAQAQGAPFSFTFARGEMEDWIIFFFLPDAQRELPGVYRGLGLKS
jgi:acetyl esterase/lipase